MLLAQKGPEHFLLIFCSILWRSPFLRACALVALFLEEEGWFCAITVPFSSCSIAAEQQKPLTNPTIGETALLA